MPRKRKLLDTFSETLIVQAEVHSEMNPKNEVKRISKVKPFLRLKKFHQTNLDLIETVPQESENSPGNFSSQEKLQKDKEEISVSDIDHFDENIFVPKKTPKKSTIKSNQTHFTIDKYVPKNNQIVPSLPKQDFIDLLSSTTVETPSKKKPLQSTDLHSKTNLTRQKKIVETQSSEDFFESLFSQSKRNNKMDIIFDEPVKKNKVKRRVNTRSNSPKRLFEMGLSLIVEALPIIHSLSKKYNFEDELRKLKEALNSIED